MTGSARASRVGGVLVACAALAASACGREAPGGADAAVERDGGPTALAPAIPWLAAGAPPVAVPSLAPCPAGWREVVDADGLVGCDPFPATGQATCGPGEAHFPGRPGCGPVGAPCPAAEFSETLPADRPVVHVSAGAAPGGDGTLARPYASVTEFSVGALSRGSVIALGKGLHEGPVRLPAEIALQGACAAETIVRSAAPDDREPVVGALGAGASVRDLQIGASARPGLAAAGDGRSLDLEGVSVEGARRFGIVAALGGTIRARDVSVRGTAPDSAALFGRGIAVELGSSADVEGAVLADLHDVGAAATGAGSSLRLADAVIRGVEPEAARGQNGMAVAAGLGASVRLERVVAWDARSSGAVADGAGTALTVDRLVVSPGGESGVGPPARVGVLVQGGASLRARFVDVRRALTAGVAVQGDGTSGELEDLIVRDVVGHPDDHASGAGLQIATGATASARRVWLSRMSTGGLVLSDASTTGAVEDLTVRDVAGRMLDGDLGVGVQVQLGAALSAIRTTVERTHMAGVNVAFGGSTATLHDALVREVAARPGGTAGRGVNVEVGATATLGRVVVRDAREAGISMYGEGTALRLEDALVAGTRSRDVDGGGGRGIDLAALAQAELARVFLERNRDVGVLAILGAEAIFEVLSVRDTLPPACAPDRCPGSPGGLGIASIGGSRIVGSGVRVEAAGTCGVMVADASHLELHGGEVRGAPIGACVQVDGYDLGLLTDGVAYRDNETNLQATMLPVPSPLAPVDAGGT